MARARTQLAGQAEASARYLRISAPKLNQVAALIRGEHVDEARRILAFTPKAASHELSKVLEAAIANAEQNHDLVAHELFVKEVRCDEGPTLKRFRPRALGRAYRIRKRTSHLHITLERRTAETPARGGGGSKPRRRPWRRDEGEGQAGTRGETAPGGRRRGAAAAKDKDTGEPRRTRRSVRQKATGQTTGRGAGKAGGAGAGKAAGRGAGRGGDKRGS